MKRPAPVLVLTMLLLVGAAHARTAPAADAPVAIDHHDHDHGAGEPWQNAALWRTLKGDVNGLILVLGATAGWRLIPARRREKGASR